MKDKEIGGNTTVDAIMAFRINEASTLNALVVARSRLQPSSKLSGY
jgi:hypothetical protein